MKPFISVIIPVLNGEKFISNCLTAVENLDYPKEKMEVIVVDNGSTDKTQEIAAQFNARILEIKNCTISAVRNFGAKNSKGDIFAFVDADCVPKNNWLKIAVSCLEKNEEIGITGCAYDLPENPAYIEKAWDIHMKPRREVLGEIDYIPGGSFLIRRIIFEVCQGFNESLITAEDVDFCERVREEGMVVFSVPELAMPHLGNPKTLKDFFKKQYWRGKGVAQMASKGELRPEFKNAFFFAVVFLILMISAGFGILLIVLKKSFVFLIPFLLMFLVSMVLSFKSSLRGKSIKYFFSLSLLFLIYGISRACVLAGELVLSILLRTSVDQ